MYISYAVHACLCAPISCFSLWKSTQFNHVLLSCLIKIGWDGRPKTIRLIRIQFVAWLPNMFLIAVSESTVNMKYMKSNWTLKTNAYSKGMATFAYLGTEGYRVTCIYKGASIYATDMTQFNIREA